MSQTRNNKAGRRRRERQISVRAVRRAEIDTRKLGRVLIAAALAKAEAEAKAAAERPDQERSA